MTRPLRVGIIGAGQVVENVHLPVLATALPTTVAWILDVDAARARRLARAYGVPAGGPGDLEARLPGTDVVLVAAPLGARDGYYERLARSPAAALFVEKPLARTLARHLAICRPYADYQVACGLNRRAAETVQAARRLLAEGVFGPLRAIRVAFGRRGAILGGGYHGDPALAGGGVLLEMGVHYVDAALYCAGATGVEVEAGWMIEDLGLDVHTEARLRATAAGGAPVPMTVTVSLLTDQPEGVAFECEHAALSLSLARDRLLLRGRDGGAVHDLTAAPGSRPSTAFRLIHAFWREFLDGLRARRPGFAAAAASLLTTQAIEGLYALPRRR